MKKIISVMVLVGILLSCEDKDAITKELALRDLQVKIDQLKQRKNEECTARALALAETHVDSLIRQSILNPMNSDTYHPTRPEKPKFVPIDSSVFKSESSVKQIKDPT